MLVQPNYTNRNHKSGLFPLSSEFLYLDILNMRNYDDVDEENIWTATFFCGFPSPFLRVDGTRSARLLDSIPWRLSGAKITSSWIRSFLPFFCRILDLKLLYD